VVEVGEVQKVDQPPAVIEPLAHNAGAAGLCLARAVRPPGAQSPLCPSLGTYNMCSINSPQHSKLLSAYTTVRLFDMLQGKSFWLHHGRLSSL
jgi:hypothetical protein